MHQSINQCETTPSSPSTLTSTSHDEIATTHHGNGPDPKRNRGENETMDAVHQGQAGMQHYQRLPWCPAINDLVTKINMMKLTLTSMNNKIDMTKQIASQRKNLKTEFMIPAIKDDLNKEIRAARKQIRIKWKKKR